MTTRRDHWDGVYTARDPKAVTWYQPSLAKSLDLIDGLGLPAGARILDVGGGASTLAGDLLARGLAVSVLDVSQAALGHAREGLGTRAGEVDWIVADITKWQPEAAYDLWHDRAVFHFLTEAVDRAAYVAAAQQALKPGGQLIIATFALDGPEKCSGLPVARYDGAGLAAAMGAGFELAIEQNESHITPKDNRQSFCWALFRRV